MSKNLYDLIDLKLLGKPPKENVFHPSMGVGGYDAKRIRAAREISTYKIEWAIEKIKNNELLLDKFLVKVAK